MFYYGGLPSQPSDSTYCFDEKYLTYPKGKDAGKLTETGPFKHWLSIDKTRGKLRYGRGYCTAALVLLEVELKWEDKKKVWHFLDNKWAWLHHLQVVQISKSSKPPTISAFPLVRDVSPYIIKDQDITLDDLENGFATVFANLPEVCQTLYHNVAGPNILLDTPDFPDFSSAIEHSVNTEGCVAYNLLREKASKPGHDIVNTYLRITIGPPLGNSPGIPYVLEIWPAQHQSPIHDHGDACAIIKVLHGSIMAYYFESLKNPLSIGQGAKLKKGDVTWISSDNYQVHQLRNESMEGKVCCTIQSYQYAKGDKKHCEVFHFLSDDKVVDNFVPNSDMSFGNFKEAIKTEWKAVLAGHR
ncbi:hypothetical protein M422DRAFT_223367 [Sphaerobolus stellatus SS14]|nr:hypothetical protein M422DRAFT_223367 [Sphaerobolus stellatus SS14]